MDTLKEFDTTIVAITPQLAEASRLLISRQKITFDLLSDPGNGYTATLGLRFKLPDDLKAVYLSFGNDLAVRNGEDSWTLPMPGRFVVAAPVSSGQLMSIPIMSIGQSRKRRLMMSKI
jgi:peroxiredoxin